MTGLPTGTVTFLFTDIEGSTELLQRLGDRRYAEVLDEHRRILRATFTEGHGREIDTQGDAFLVAFSRARDAVATAVAAQRALLSHAWPDGASLRVRMGLHTGEPVSGTSGYVGLDVHRAARICTAGHGGQILVSGTVSGLAERDLPPGVSLRDLGTHRLKDLREPEHLFQVASPDLRADFPPLKSLNVRPNNLPIQLTSFVGREREIAGVKESLSVSRLVTLTGTGGAGKTRLALQVGANVLDEYSDGVWLAQFAALSEPTLVPKAVASALGIPEQPGRPLTDSVVDYLRPRSPLLVLDNCEHLLGACAQLADSLLQGCVNLRIVATSREALGIAGELTYRIPSLSLPDLKRLPPLETLAQYEAIRLFVERAAFSRPGFQITGENAAAVAQVTHRLDGIPLAIELAAARVKALPVDVIAERLDDQFRLLTGGSRTGPPRHQTLRATLDWSYNLLSEQERILLRRLSVFAGGFTLVAAEEICWGQGVDADEVVELLTHLNEKSLVVFQEQEGRYLLLETVRQYGLEKLGESGEQAEVRQKHRDWYLELAERAAPEFQSRNQIVWLQRLDQEHDNLRAALECAVDSSDGAVAMRIVAAVSMFWYVRGYWSEALTWSERVLRWKADAPASAVAKVLRGQGGRLAERDEDLGRALLEESLGYFRQARDTKGLALATLMLGLSYSERDNDRAQALWEEALVLARAAADPVTTSRIQINLVLSAHHRGDDRSALALAEESLRVARDVGDRWVLSLILLNLSRITRDRGEYGRAQAFLEEGLLLAKDLHHLRFVGLGLEGFAEIASVEQRHARAALFLGAAERLREILGTKPYASEHRVGLVDGLRDALGEAGFQAALAEGRAMTLEQVIEYALSVEDD